MITTKAGGRELCLWWDLEAWFEVEEKLGSIEKMTKRILGDDEQPARASAALICACVNAGYRRSGSKERIDENWLNDNVGAKAFKRLNTLARRAYIEGMAREENEEESETAVDVVAQQIKKKEE